MKGMFALAAGLLCLIALGGCRYLARPDWTHPGSAKTQQNRALRYDPYPESEPGPALVGARPREYQTAPPEASRARWHLGGWGQ